MAEIVKFEVTGISETKEALDWLGNEIGDKRSTSKFLIPALKEAMKPVFERAKANAPYDTSPNHQGPHMRDMITLFAKRPTKKDKQSKYVRNDDKAIAVVGTRDIPKLKKKFLESHATLLDTLGSTYKGTKARNDALANVKKAKRKYYKQNNSFYDARVIANEFGTAKRPATPFLRSALESQADAVARSFGQILNEKIRQYRSKTS